MWAMNRYGQMLLKSLLFQMKELGVSQTELVPQMKASRPYVGKAFHGEINLTLVCGSPRQVPLV